MLKKYNEFTSKVSIIAFIAGCIIGPFLLAFLKMIYNNITQPVAIILSSIIAMIVVAFCIRSSQKNRLAQTIMKSKIEWMQNLRGFIQEYIACLNKLNEENSDEKNKVLPELYTAKDKIISCIDSQIDDNSPDKAILDCLGYYDNDVYIEKLKKLSNINSHKNELIKITRCYFQAEWESVKSEGHKLRILKNKQKDFNFIESYNEYYNNYDKNNK